MAINGQDVYRTDICTALVDIQNIPTTFNVFQLCRPFNVSRKSVLKLHNTLVYVTVNVGRICQFIYMPNLIFKIKIDKYKQLYLLTFRSNYRYRLYGQYKVSVSSLVNISRLLSRIFIARTSQNHSVLKTAIVIETPRFRNTKQNMKLLQSSQRKDCMIAF